MWVISARTLHFRRGTVEEHPVSHEKFFVQTEEFMLVPDFQNPQQPVWAPDWIKDEDLYKLVKKENKKNHMVLQETAEGPSEEEDEEPEKSKHHEQHETKGLKNPVWKK
jgi:hypothetical protein